MSKRRNNHTCLKSCIALFVTVIVVCGVALAGGYLYLKNYMGIDLFSTMKQISTLKQEVNEDEVCDNKFEEADKESAMEKANDACPGLITKDESGYKINYDTSVELKSDLKFTDKEVAAAVAIALEQENVGGAKESKLKFELKQISFEEIKENGSADIRIIAKIDLEALLAESGASLGLLKNMIPGALYIGTIVSIEKTDEAFGYTYKSNGITANKLDEQGTKELLQTIGKIAPEIGEAQVLEDQISGALAQGLIGSEENKGFVYSLKDKGATGFNFLRESDTSYIVIKVG